MKPHPAEPAATPVDDLLQQAWEMRHEDTRAAMALNLRAYGDAWAQGYVRGVGLALLRVGLCRVVLGDDDELAASQVDRALSLLRSLEDLAGEAEALNLAAHLKSRRSDHGAALELYGRCLALRRRLDDRLGEGAALNNMALILRDTQRYADALELALASLEIAREVGDAGAEAHALFVIGGVLAATGDAQAAVDHLERCLALTAKTRDRAFECSTRVSLGQALLALGRGEPALAHLHRALALARGTGNRGDLVDALAALGQGEQSLGRLAEAQALFDEALQVLVPLRDRCVEAGVLCAAGHNRLLGGDVAGALPVLQQALARAEAGGEVETAAKSNRLLADVFEALGDTAAALRHHRAFHAGEQRLHGLQARQRLFEVLTHAKLQPLRREVEAQRRRLRELGAQLELVKRRPATGA